MYYFPIKQLGQHWPSTLYVGYRIFPKSKNSFPWGGDSTQTECIFLLQEIWENLKFQPTQISLSYITSIWTRLHAE